MNMSQKCNCCAHDPVCKYKEIYAAAKAAILNAPVPDGGAAWAVKDCPHVEVSIRCPHITTITAMRRTENE